jgi:predicted NAD/FAD-dependent oxidoreductase
MLLTLLQIAGVALVAGFLLRWRATAKRRSTMSWDTLIARLRPEWSAHQLSDHFLWESGINATQENAWSRMEGPKGLWTMYKNAIVMQEMADFAARHCEGVDPVLVQMLHSDAMQIRVCILYALVQYAFSHTSAGVRVNAFRAATMYSEMAARMTCFMQEYAAGQLPNFVEAM